jgi:hypothetical protein
MPRTLTLPLTEPTMWRKLLARTHPDAGGSHELFIWTGALKDVVCRGEGSARPKPEPRAHPSRRHEGSTWRPTQADDKPRIPCPTGADFEEITRRALRLVDDGNAYAGVLSLLLDCYPLEHLAYEQERGASYRRLAAIAHTWGMTKAERIGWYRVAEGIPLSDRHAGHILSRLKRQAA